MSTRIQTARLMPLPALAPVGRSRSDCMFTVVTLSGFTFSSGLLASSPPKTQMPIPLRKVPSSLSPAPRAGTRRRSPRTARPHPRPAPLRAPPQKGLTTRPTPAHRRSLPMVPPSPPSRSSSMRSPSPPSHRASSRRRASRRMMTSCGGSPKSCRESVACRSVFGLQSLHPRPSHARPHPRAQHSFLRCSSPPRLLPGRVLKPGRRITKRGQRICCGWSCRRVKLLGADAA